jgi:hypothetical protein
MAAFTELNDSTDRMLAWKWAKQAKVAQTNRVDRPEAMLIYEVQMEKGQANHHQVC